MFIATSDVIRTGNLSVRFLLKVVEKSWYRIRGALLERLAEPDEALTRCHFRYMRYLAEKLSTRGAGRLWQLTDKLPMMLNAERQKQSKHAE